MADSMSPCDSLDCGSFKRDIPKQLLYKSVAWTEIMLRKTKMANKHLIQAFCNNADGLRGPAQKVNGLSWLTIVKTSSNYGKEQAHSFKS